MLLDQCGGCYFDLDVELNGKAGYDVAGLLRVLDVDASVHNGAVFWERGLLSDAEEVESKLNPLRLGIPE